ncbi:MAG: sigma-54-dependent transcriptional regulator [Desulfatirhabdiaceae bacterium]
METILIVDDEKNYPLILSAVLQEEGYETLIANSGQAALDIMNQAEVDLVITDMKMPSMDGVELLEHIKTRYSDIPVIMMTAYGTVEKAVEAMQKGAFNYIQKPFDNDRLIAFVNRAIASYRVVKENRELRSAIETRYSFGNIIGKSKGMLALYEMIQKVAYSTATVLIEGESGTGKELVARSIHFNSPRRDRAFIAVNCSALSESLLESELFGHEKGAFTGAVASKKGRFELANGGTLFLDEIGDISPALQVKLLRVLQERVFERVGGIKSIPIDIRVIAATNKILKMETEKGRFREDLYYRLNVIHLILPPLRERLEDIRLLTDHLIARFAKERRPDIPPVTGVDPEVDRLFSQYHWPGNVRELENVIERAMVLCPGNRIRISDLPHDFRNQIGPSLNIDSIPANAPLYETLASVEKQLIEKALEMTNHVQAHAAELLGIGKSNLHQKIRKHGIKTPSSGDVSAG